jgi:acyl carrier protein
MKIVGFDRFCSLFRDEFELDDRPLSRDTHLVNDLGFDSLELFRLAILVEMLAPIDLPDEIDFNTLTIGSVYDHYAVTAALLD